MKRSQINRAGIWLMVFSFPYLIVGILGMMAYILFHTQLLSIQSALEELPSEMVELFGDISIFSNIGMILLALSIGSLAIWFFMMIIGIANIRRYA